MKYCDVRIKGRFAVANHRNDVLRIFAAAEREAYGRGWRDAIEAVMKSNETLTEPSPQRAWKSEFEVSDETEKSLKGATRDAALRRAGADSTSVRPMFGTDNPFRKAE